MNQNTFKSNTTARMTTAKNCEYHGVLSIDKSESQVSPGHCIIRLTLCMVHAGGNDEIRGSQRNSAAKENPPDNHQHRQHGQQRVFENKPQKGGCVDLLLIGNGLDHEVRTV